MKHHALPFLALLLAACTTATSVPGASPAPPPSSPSVVAPTPAPASPAAACAAVVTLAQTEGPFYKAGSPERTTLVETGMAGTRVVLAGRVMSRSCAPVAGTILDFWQADADGNYDNAGYRLRGHLTADAQGGYRVETILPGQYPGRTRHIHVKVQAPRRPPLTTQIYFPDEARNASDSIFRPELLATLDRSATPISARFDFVLDLP